MDKLLYDLFQSYYDARRNKRSTINALAFETNYESKLFQLYQEIKSGSYKISPSKTVPHLYRQPNQRKFL